MGTLCKSCGNDNPTGLRFCAHCAVELANVCLACGFENPTGFKFCGQCGANLAQAQFAHATADELRRLQSYIPGHLVEKMARQGEKLKGERRTVAILFADLCGFTSISEQLDPEEVYSIMDELFRIFVEQIYHFEGSIDKFTGDGLMALFGAPVAHENDAERSLRAAMGMQSALEGFGQALAQQHEITLRCRIGIHLGEVIVGGLGSDLRLDYTAMGDVVNVAARLEQSADPGAILVSQAVYDETKALFHFQPAGELVLKGRSSPVVAYRLDGEKAVKGRVRGLPGLEARLIGRQRELADICEATARSISQGSGHIILVTGEAGIGKSRLTAEWRSSSAVAGMLLLQSSSFSHTSSIGLWAIRDMLRGYFAFNEGATVQEARGKIHQRLNDLLGPAASEALPFLEYLFSPDMVEPQFKERIGHLTPAELRQQTFLTVRDLLMAEARRRPLALVFEDIHWIDRPSLDVLLFILNIVEFVPAVFYCISRPDEGTAISELIHLASQHFDDRVTQVHLGPLTPVEVDQLVNELLAAPDLPDTLRSFIPERAEGNPFFLEEIIRTMIERGILCRQLEGTWKAVLPEGTVFDVPRTLRGLILARVDSLAEIQRDVLQCASVVGRTFAKGVLEKVVTMPGQLVPSLARLEDSGLIQMQGDPVESIYSFHHALTHEAVYGTLIKRRKQQLHRSVGEAVEQLYAERIDEQIELLAQHFYLGDVPDRALRYLIRAGQHAAGRYANEEALQYYQRALSLQARTRLAPDERLDIHLGLGDVEGFLGRYDQALSHYEAALEVNNVDAIPPFKVGEILRKAARAYERKGSYLEAESRLGQAVNLLTDATEKAEQLELARVYSDLGWVAFRQGQMETAEQWTKQALDEMEHRGSLADVAAALNRLAGISYQQGEWKLAAEYALRGLELREQIGYTYGLAMSYNNLSVIYFAGGDWAEGIGYAEKSLELKQRMGDVEGMGISYNNLGAAYKDLGDLATAREFLQNSLETAKRIKNANMLASTLSNLGQVALLTRHLSEAIGYFEESLEVALASGSNDQIAEAAWLLTEVWAIKGDPQRAQGYADKARAFGGEVSSRSVLALACRARAALYRQENRREEAVQALRQSLEHYSDLRNRLEVGRSHYQLGLALADLNQMDEAVDHVDEAILVYDSLGLEQDSQEARRQRQSWRAQEGVADAGGLSADDAVDTD